MESQMYLSIQKIQINIKFSKEKSANLVILLFPQNLLNILTFGYHKLFVQNVLLKIQMNLW